MMVKYAKYCMISALTISLLTMAMIWLNSTVSANQISYIHWNAEWQKIIDHFFEMNCLISVIIGLSATGLAIVALMKRNPKAFRVAAYSIIFSLLNIYI